jgi:hypothetical protein
LWAKKTLTVEIELMEKPGTSIRRTGMNTKICGNQMSFQMELNALQKKSAETMAIQNTRMLFFVL